MRAINRKLDPKSKREEIVAIGADFVQQLLTRNLRRSIDIWRRYLYISKYLIPEETSLVKPIVQRLCNQF